jgi:hypothetical protein
MPETYRNFEELTLPEQYVVRMRCDGHSYKQIAEGLRREYEFERSEETIRFWLSEAKGGHLTQAFDEHKRMLSQEASDEARTILRMARKSAAVALARTLTSPNDAVVARAAALILGDVLTAPKGSDGGPDEFDEVGALTPRDGGCDCRSSKDY